MFKNKYRIVRDDYLGFEVQIRRWWLPIWLELDLVNTHMSAEDAEQYAREHAAQSRVAKYLGRL